MENKNISSANVNGAKEHYTIDIFQVLKSLWRRVWLIVLAGVLVGALGFSLSAFLIKPTYSSSVMLYVNNKSESSANNNFNVSYSDITAAQSLVKTYTEILVNRTTLEMVIEETGVEYTHKDLAKLITAAPANGTEIMRVTVTTNDPYESAKIANAIAVVLPERISNIIDGASMEIVESAIPNLEKVAPSITKYTAIGFLLGVLIATAALVIAALLDDTIHDEEYVIQIYECPILAKIPDLLDVGNKRKGYGYYYQAKKEPSEEGEGQVAE